MKTGILILGSFLVLGLIFSGCITPPNPPNPPLPPEPKQTFCETASDCAPTCSYGCVNKEWMKGKSDCEKLPLFECGCTNNKCVKQIIEVEESDDEIDSLFEDELDDSSDDLTSLENELL
ncbi:hypothetical protein KKG83_02110 [Candidatus Micrarchaeota archaeon]|nr:hypothetical protein [Candidatus Micrarchaeota archaeon]MBU2476245.1 hypothetical protein [Candidatus Micrarchaeota archaeon]